MSSDPPEALKRDRMADYGATPPLRCARERSLHDQICRPSLRASPAGGLLSSQPILASRLTASWMEARVTKPTTVPLSSRSPWPRRRLRPDERRLKGRSCRCFPMSRHPTLGRARISALAGGSRSPFPAGSAAPQIHRSRTAAPSCGAHFLGHLAQRLNARQRRRLKPSVDLAEAQAKGYRHFEDRGHLGRW